MGSFQELLQDLFDYSRVCSFVFVMLCVLSVLKGRLGCKGMQKFSERNKFSLPISSQTFHLLITPSLEVWRSPSLHALESEY